MFLTRLEYTTDKLEHFIKVKLSEKKLKVRTEKFLTLGCVFHEKLL